jgi:hypothetical protein
VFGRAKVIDDAVRIGRVWGWGGLGAWTQSGRSPMVELTPQKKQVGLAEELAQWPLCRPAEWHS